MPCSLTLKNIKIDRQALLHLSHLFAEEEGTCLLYSGGQYETSKHSFLCLLPFETIWIQGSKQQRCYSDGEHRMVLSEDNPWEALKLMLPNLNNNQHFPEWVGFLGYEMGAHSDLQKTIPLLSDGTPEAYFQRCAIVLAIDHQSDTGTVWIADQAEYFLNEKQRHWFDRLVSESQWEQLLNLSTDRGPLVYSQPSVSLIGLMDTEETYVKKIIQAKKLIQKGDIYQVNLSQKIDLQGYVDKFHLFYHLNSLNPAPFSAYLRLRDFTIVSMSPERFLKKRGEWVESRPIKGTAPRGLTPEEDVRNKMHLLTSLKERAELLMITDLMRNDLGKVSATGSVETPRLWECETYSNVFHLHATIRSRLLPHFHPVEVVRSCFPGGSVTGCPKLSAMEVIAELEKRPRGIYTGAIGYFAANGDFDFNIAIRTLMIAGDRLTVQLGGGIVADSDPLKEYEETWHKGSSIFKALNICIPSTSKA